MPGKREGPPPNETSKYVAPSTSLIIHEIPLELNNISNRTEMEITRPNQPSFLRPPLQLFGSRSPLHSPADTLFLP